MIIFNPDNIPRELKDLPQWVVRKGKVPYDPKSRKPAKAGHPETWGTFREAIEAHSRGGYDGIGFEFNNNGIVFVDLDHVINPDTGEIRSEAARIIKMLGSYTEISPSGEGLHVFVKGKLPFPGRRTTYNGIHLEVYQAKRYSTITGQVLCYCEIRSGGQALQQFCEEAFTEEPVVLQSASNKKAREEWLEYGLQRDRLLYELYNGRRDSDDESACDLALMSKLCYYADGDMNAMIQAFVESPYAAQKDPEHQRKLLR